MRRIRAGENGSDCTGVFGGRNFMKNLGRSENGIRWMKHNVCFRQDSYADVN